MLKCVFRIKIIHQLSDNIYTNFIFFLHQTPLKTNYIHFQYRLNANKAHSWVKHQKDNKQKKNFITLKLVSWYFFHCQNLHNWKQFLPSLLSLLLFQGECEEIKTSERKIFCNIFSEGFIFGLFFQWKRLEALDSLYLNGKGEKIVNKKCCCQFFDISSPLSMEKWGILLITKNIFGGGESKNVGN